MVSAKLWIRENGESTSLFTNEGFIPVGEAFIIQYYHLYSGHRAEVGPLGSGSNLTGSPFLPNALDGSHTHSFAYYDPVHKYSDRVSACGRLKWPAKLQIFAVWSLTEEVS